MLDIERNWWELTGCGSRFCSNVIRTLKDGNSVVLTGRYALPWVNLFYDKLKGAGISSTKGFDIIKPPSGCNPAEYLFNTYCSYSVQSRYWPQPPDYTHVHFLAENDDILLNHRFIVVNSFESEIDFMRWVQFVDKYISQIKAKGVDIDRRATFILQYTGRPSCHIISQQVKTISFCPQDVDLLTYNLLNTSGDRIRYTANLYAAELIGELCRSNIEICGLLAGRSELIKNPISVYITFMQENVSVDDKSEEQIRSDVSLAQLKVFFQLVEQKRRVIIKKYYAAIQAFLPWKNDYGEEKKEPYDMELRDLLYKGKEINMENTDKELVTRLRDIRNDLAHNHILSFFDVDFLINL